MKAYEIEQTVTGVILGVYEGETADGAIRECQADQLIPRSGLVAREVEDEDEDRAARCVLYDGPATGSARRCHQCSGRGTTATSPRCDYAGEVHDRMGAEDVDDE